ncbi:TULIP family P47-like protein [Xenorhabdus bovienii]|uniref:TULIP family P47-like protein n=1 Tax=Xenorhabdus bovienii TaxID=40576 RepID=UPI0023B27672|nr:TULIP family P47-like protein [Xenorhabdus bovienii]MDE9553222.1 TULIP family P47-like protein [Xenorhabdus bovienii]
MDMYNWDIVCAASCESINEKLKESMELLINRFSYTSESSFIEGEFENWQIVPGGSSQRIYFITPIKTGRLSTIISEEKIDIKVDGICPKIEVELTFVGTDTDINKTQLVFNCKTVTSTKDDILSGDGSVIIIDDDINNIFPDDKRIASEIFCQLMAEMIIENKEQLKFIFSNLVNLPQEQNDWMKTHIIQYSYNEHIDGELGELGVLSILNSNINPPRLSDLQLQFDPILIRKGDSVGFAIAKWAFMKYVILPGLPKVFNGSNINHFKIDDHNIIHNNGSIPLNKINGYVPYFENATIQIIDDKILISNATGRCDVVSGSSYVTFSLSSVYSTSLQKNNNRPKIGLDTVSPPEFTSVAHDSLALTFWILGGWVVDALIQGIRSQMNELLWSFGDHGIEFDIFPIDMNINVEYNECGLTENFYMRG